MEVRYDRHTDISTDSVSLYKKLVESKLVKLDNDFYHYKCLDVGEVELYLGKKLLVLICVRSLIYCVFMKV